jgi:uncharacterized membrane protein YjjP (DUF1212 family)
MLREEFYTRIKFIVQFGKAMHSVGSPAHTLEGALAAMSEKCGIKATFVALPTALFSSFRFLDEEVTRITKVEPTGIHLGRLVRVDQIAQKVISGEMSFSEGGDELEKLFSLDDAYPRSISALFFMLTSAGMMTLFGGSWGDFFASALVGAVIGFLTPKRRDSATYDIREAYLAFFSTLMALSLNSLFSQLSPGIIILSSLIIFVPGLNITIAIAEIATHNLTSGTSRLMGGLLVLLKLTFGVYAGYKLIHFFPVPALEWSFSRVPNEIIFLAVPVTSLMSTFVFKASWSEAKWITLAGIFGYSWSKLGTYYLGPEMGLLVGGMAVGAGANLFARLKNAPSSLFQFPGLILLVPGSVGYRGLSSLFNRDVVAGFDTAFTMLTLALSLVMGVFIGNRLIKPRRIV